MTAIHNYVRRFAVIALLLIVGVTVASAQVTTRDHRDKKPPPPPPPEDKPDQPPPPPPFKWDTSGWKMLGEVTVAGKKTKATINVGAYEGRFDQLTMVVMDADVDVRKFVVHFGNGDKFDPKVKHKFAEGTRTRVLDLPGNDRLITKIDLTFKGVRGQGVATVQVWGRDTRGGKDDRPPPAPKFDPTGWEKLGTLQTDKDSRRDTIKVGRDDGRFTKVTFVVRDDDLEIYDVKITFGNGEVFSPTTRMYFKEDTRTGVIDLPGEKRFIKKIEFDYKNVGRGKKASIAVWGWPAKEEAPPPPKFDDKGWEKLGTLKTGKKNRRDTIKVGRDDGRFTKVTFVVADDDLEIYGIKITFGNGETFSPDVRMTFKEDTRTAVIDLPGEKRYISQIEFDYKNVGRGKKATIIAYGWPAKGDDVPNVPKFDSKGWEKLGTLKTDKRGRRDTIKVGRDDGAFTKVTFVVEGDDLEIYGVKITFGNGETMSPDTRLYFRENARSAVIDLPGEKRFIKSIEFDYKNLGRGKKASIVAWGWPAPKADTGGGGTTGGGGNVKVRDHRKWDNKGWEMLGEQEVNGQNDFDVITVGAREGKFTQITLAVVDGAMDLESMTVHFKKGKDLEIKGAYTFKEGAWTRVVDLPGDKRVIETITLKYSKASRKPAKIQVWAK